MTIREGCYHEKDITFDISYCIAGCTYSMTDLKAQPKNYAGKSEFYKNYQEVYRTLMDMSRRCLEDTSFSSEVTISGDIYHDIKEGQIRQRLSGQGILITTSAIDIKALEDKKTGVTLYVVDSAWYGAGITIPGIKDVVRWINGDRECWIVPPEPVKPY